MNQFLIPANSKKSQLKLGFFTNKDIVVCIIGGLLTLLMLVVFHDPPLWLLIIAITPLLLAALLVFPVPYYHNVMQLLTNILYFAIGRKRYYWKGWCVKDDTNE